MLILEALSWFATLLCCMANIPQVWRVWHNKSSANLSMLTNFTWLFIVTIMFLRAVFIVHDLVFIVAQGAQMIIMVFLVGVLLKYKVVK